MSGGINFLASHLILDKKLLMFVSKILYQFIKMDLTVMQAKLKQLPWLKIN